MHTPRSLLLTPLLSFSLLSLSPSLISATPTPQPTYDTTPTPPIPTPDFSNCIFPAVVDTTIRIPFSLSLLSDSLPLQEWPVRLRSTPTGGSTLSAYIARIPNQVSPLFSLTDGVLNTTGTDAVPKSGQFVPSKASPPLQRLVFGEREGAADFYAIRNCDATATPYTELKTGRELLIKDFVPNAFIYGKEPEDVYLGKSQIVHLRITVEE